jgi:hypothetical protein
MRSETHLLPPPSWYTSVRYSPILNKTGICEQIWVNLPSRIQPTTFIIVSLEYISVLAYGANYAPVFQAVSFLPASHQNPPYFYIQCEPRAPTICPYVTALNFCKWLAESVVIVTSSVTIKDWVHWWYVVCSSSTFNFLINVSEKRKSTPLSASQVKNQRKTISTEDKLDVINWLAKC